MSYEINQPGVTKFDDLCETAWSADNFSSFSAAVAACSGVDRPNLHRLFAARKQLMRERVRQLDAIELGALSEPLARREQRLINTEIEWLDDELRRIKQ